MKGCIDLNYGRVCLKDFIGNFELYFRREYIKIMEEKNEKEVDILD